MKLTKFAYFLLFLSQVTVIYIFLNLTTHQGYTLFDFLVICVLFICFIIQTAYLMVIKNLSRHIHTILYACLLCVPQSSEHIFIFMLVFAAFILHVIITVADLCERILKWSKWPKIRKTLKKLIIKSE